MSSTTTIELSTATTDYPVETFGSVLRHFRRRANVTQEELGLICECDSTFFSRLERGQRAAPRQIVVKVADALALPPGDRARLFSLAGFWPDHWQVD